MDDNERTDAFKGRNDIDKIAAVCNRYPSISVDC